MHVLANWIAKLVQFLYCSIIYHADCNSGPFCTFKWTFLSILVDLLCSLVDLFVHFSGPFGGPFSDWGVLQSPENPPWLQPCKYNSLSIELGLNFYIYALLTNLSYYAPDLEGRRITSTLISVHHTKY